MIPVHFKKLLVLSVGLLCMSFVQLHAQTSNLWLGVRAGADIGKFSFDPEPPSEISVGTKAGITAGGELDFWFSDMFGITAQVLYTQKGLTQSFSDFGLTIEDSYTISYLQIPVLLKLTLSPGDLKPYIFAGPELGIKLSATEKFTQNGKDSTIDAPDSTFTSSNVGIMVGAGASYTLNSSTMLFFDVAYDHGLTNLNGTSSKDTDKGYSRDFRICLGILFRIGD